MNCTIPRPCSEASASSAEGPGLSYIVLSRPAVNILFQVWSYHDWAPSYANETIVTAWKKKSKTRVWYGAEEGLIHWQTHWHEFCLCSITQFTWNKWVSFNLRVCTLQSDFLRNIRSHSIRSCTIFGANSPHNHKCREQRAASSMGERFPGSWHASAFVMGMEPVPFHDVAFHNGHLHTVRRWAVVRI